MPRDDHDTLDIKDNEEDITVHELEEFKHFCFMNKPLENYPKVTVRVNLFELSYSEETL